MHLPGTNNVVRIKDTTALGVRTFYVEDSQRILHIWWEAQWVSLILTLFSEATQLPLSTVFLTLEAADQELPWQAGHSGFPQNAHDAEEPRNTERRGVRLKCSRTRSEISDWEALNRSAPPVPCVDHSPSIYSFTVLCSSKGDHILAHIITHLPSLCIHSYLLKAATILFFNLALSSYPFGCREWKLHSIQKTRIFLLHFRNLV